MIRVVALCAVLVAVSIVTTYVVTRTVLQKSLKSKASSKAIGTESTNGIPAPTALSTDNELYEFLLKIDAVSSLEELEALSQPLKKVPDARPWSQDLVIRYRKDGPVHLIKKIEASSPTYAEVYTICGQVFYLQPEYSVRLLKTKELGKYDSTCVKCHKYRQGFGNMLKNVRKD